MPLPLKQSTRASIEDTINHAVPLLFQEAVGEVLTYIEEYQFPRFSKSQLMNKVVALIALEAIQPKANKRRASIILQPISAISGNRYNVAPFN